MEFDEKYDILDMPTPRHNLLSARYKQSFAYYTLRERLPVILTTVIDGLNRDKDILAEKFGGEPCREEIKTVVGNLSKLKYKLQTDKDLTPFQGNEADKDLWNAFISKLHKDEKSFFRTCWLYAECYMYRKVKSYFEMTTTLSDYDYFEKQKQNATIVSLEAMQAIATEFVTNAGKSEEAFFGWLKLNLWGNRMDLSITTGKEIRPDSNSLEMIKSLDSSLLIDQAADIWHCLAGVSGTKSSIVDIVCDNAGFEFFTDLILADFIIQTNLAEKVRFHVKAIPWFISDVTHRDFHWAIDYYKKCDSKELRLLGARWSGYVSNGQFELQPLHYFWTSPYEYYRMREVAMDLYKKLSEAQLIIFKGDLNYRKLIGDFAWDYTEPFVTCLRGFTPSNLCTLRTVKADLICGLPSEIVDKMHATKRDWMTTGEFGVIQFNSTIPCDCAD